MQEPARPFRGALLTSILPPCDCTMLFASDNPSPVPSLRVVKNGLKIFGRASGRNSPARVGHLHDRLHPVRGRWHFHFARPGNGLDAIQQQIQHHLLDQRGIVVHSAAATDLP